VITAQDIVESKVWQETVSTLEAELWEQFQQVPPDHAAGLTGISHKFWALREVCAELERVARSGAERRGNRGS
jgi:hypothetical protein